MHKPEELLNALAAGEITRKEFKEQARQFLPSAWLFHDERTGNYTFLPFDGSGEREVGKRDVPGLYDKYNIRAVITFSSIEPVTREEDLPEPEV